MAKEIRNSSGNIIVFDDSKVIFKTENVEILYNSIEAIGLNKSGDVLNVKYQDNCTATFAVDEKDREEIKKIIKDIKKKAVEADLAVANIRMYTRAGIGITLFALIAVGFTLLLTLLNTVTIIIILALTAIIFVSFFVNTCKIDYAPLTKPLFIRNCICQVLIFVICVSCCLGIFFYFKPGFVEGEFLNKTCRWVGCYNAADGGVKRGGLYDPDEYFCKEHFELEKNHDSNKNVNSGSNSNSSTPSFTNKYGSPTTKCYISGCNNYIATSGDTNCCTKHSNRCLNCNCYIDSDAMYCMKCLSDALGK